MDDRMVLGRLLLALAVPYQLVRMEVGWILVQIHLVYGTRRQQLLATPCSALVRVSALILHISVGIHSLAIKPETL